MKKGRLAGPELMTVFTQAEVGLFHALLATFRILKSAIPATYSAGFAQPRNPAQSAIYG